MSIATRHDISAEHCHHDGAHHDGAHDQKNTSARRARLVYLVLGVALVASVGWSASVGQFGATVGESLASIARLIAHGGPTPGQSPTVDIVLWDVRLPRIALAMLVGSGLAVAGVALQAIFGNPLAEPGLIGVSSGAAVGAALVTIASTTLVSLGASGQWLIAIGAFVGGVVATLVVAAAASGGRDIARIILVGVAVNAVCGGIVALLTFIASPTARDRIVFWQMGSFASGDWQQVGVVLAITVPVVAMLVMLSRQLDILSLGETQARHLGVDVTIVRRIVILATALLVAVGVAFSGIIVFIGLVVPHALRLIMGPGHTHLLPASILGGAFATTVADLAARSIVSGADLPLGMLTSLVGGPVFFWLLVRGGRLVRS